MIDTKELRKLAQAATPGGWYVEGNDVYGCKDVTDGEPALRPPRRKRRNQMSTEFKREDRYIVFKLSDVERYLTDADRAHLAMMKNEIDAGRDCANKPPFKGLIVESDWPEYEPTWKAIEARVTGAQPAPSFADAYQGTMEDVPAKSAILEDFDDARAVIAKATGGKP